MSRMVSATERAANSAQRLFEILDRVPSVAEPAVPVHPENLRGEVELRGVGFRYGTRSIIENFNLKIESGEMIGLVGASGSGKTTLVNLVCRFYDVSEGAILVDGIDIRQFSVAEYRRQIGLVLQEPFLFFGTVAENIAYGRPEATPDEIIAAARAARAHDFILRLPLGYNSLVGERGQFLSGGERQRISIARALLINPRISDPGRSDLQRRHHDRARDSIGPRQPGPRADDDRHRPSLTTLEQGRPAGGAGAGRDRRSRQARRAAGQGRGLRPAVSRTAARALTGCSRSESRRGGPPRHALVTLANLGQPPPVLSPGR